MSEFQPSMWKPRAKAILTIDQLPLDRELVVTTKMDGEFSVISYQRGVRTFSINLWGTMYGESCPWLKELKEALDKQPVQEAVLLAETYAVEGDRMLKLPDLIHHLKNGDQTKIRLGVFDLASVNGKTVNQSYLWRLQEAETWLKGCQQVHVVPYIQPRSRDEIRAFWNYWVEQRRYEGLFARDDRQDLYKVKPYLDIDAVIIGLNKTPSFPNREVTSFKIALRDNDGKFIQVGDVASGIDHQLRRALYEQLMPYKRQEYDAWVQIEPFLVVQVQATDTFQAYQPSYVLLQDGSLEYAVNKEAFSLRHPRFVRFRGDKKPTVEDIGYDRQLPNN